MYVAASSDSRLTSAFSVWSNTSPAVAFSNLPPLSQAPDDLSRAAAVKTLSEAGFHGLANLLQHMHVSFTDEAGRVHHFLVLNMRNVDYANGMTFQLHYDRSSDAVSAVSDALHTPWGEQIQKFSKVATEPDGGVGLVLCSPESGINLSIEETGAVRSHANPCTRTCTRTETYILHSRSVRGRAGRSHS